MAAREARRRGQEALGLLVAIGIAASAGSAQAFRAAPPPLVQSEIATAIRDRLEGQGAVRVAGRLLHSAPELRAFYGTRAWAPVFVAGTGASPQATEVLTSVQASIDDGFEPETYHASAIARAMQALQPVAAFDARGLAGLDLLLSDALATLARHRARGRIDPRAAHPSWSMPREPFDGTAILRTAVAYGVGPALAAAEPSDRRMAWTRSALRRYRALAREPWPVVPVGASLRAGDRNARVSVLARRLHAEGWITDTTVDGAFDSALEEAVRAFQRAHGLIDDGIVGRRTIEALNVSADQRVRELELNLERLRWMQPGPQDGYIEVNIPGMALRSVEDGRTVLGMKTVVGLRTWQTPVFSGRIENLVFSPYWNIPRSIVTREQLPRIRQDPDYLRRNAMEVVTGFGAGARVIDPSGIDWPAMTAAAFPWDLRQRPGGANPLGGVKFEVRSPFDVHLHDTPSKAAFATSDRALSHGCIRLENAPGLAEWLLRGTWSADSIVKAMASRSEHVVALPRAVDVHLIYLTAWAEGDTVQFRHDVYGHDARLRRLLAVRFAAAAPVPPPRSRPAVGH